MRGANTKNIALLNIFSSVLLLSLLLLSDVTTADSSDPYSVLGLPRDVTVDKIKSTYRRFARELHPDAVLDSTTDAEREVLRKKFIAVTEAYELLMDPKKRKQYDEERYVQEAQGERNYLRYNLFEDNFDGVQLSTEQFETITAKLRAVTDTAAEPTAYAIFLWSSQFLDSVEAGKQWKLVAQRLKGTNVRIAAVRCDQNQRVCRLLGAGAVPDVFILPPGPVAPVRYTGKFEHQSMLEALVPYITLRKGVVRKGSLSTFERCASFVPSLQMSRQTVLHRTLVSQLITFEYSECFDCGNELKMVLATLQSIEPTLRVVRMDCEEGKPDEDNCLEFGRRNANAAWTMGTMWYVTPATYTKKGELRVKESALTSTWYTTRRHRASDYLAYYLKVHRTHNNGGAVALGLDTIVPSQTTSIKEAEDAFVVVFRAPDTNVADLVVPMEVFASDAATLASISYDKKPSARIRVAQVACGADDRHGLCADISDEHRAKFPVVAIYPFGVKAKSKPPVVVTSVVDAAHLADTVRREAIPLRLYVLTADTFNSKVVRTIPPRVANGKDAAEKKKYEKLVKQPWFVLYNAGTWCPPCNNVREEWKKLARMAQMKSGVASKLRIAQVDCDKHKTLCRKQKIDNYPTFVFYQGDTEKVFEGTRDAASFLDFAIESVDNPVETIAQMQPIMSHFHTPDAKPFLVLYNAGTWCPPCQEMKPIYKEFARHVKKQEGLIGRPLLRVGVVDCDEMQWICNRMNVDGYPTVMLVRPNAHTTHVMMPTTKDKSVAQLTEFVKEYVPGV
eukprot:PhM_4_TR5681/c0_g1_i1/m.73903/K09530/DNAJC10; DnaJ homolog subfamily C member 10